MALSDEFISIVRCLESGSPLHLASDAVLEKINNQIEQRDLKSRDGQLIELPCDAGLVNESLAILYPVRDDITTLILDSAINLDQLD